MRLFGLALGFLVACVSGASANWEYTRWGMTPEQVVAASKGTAKMLPENQRTVAGGMRAAAAGSFTDGGVVLDVRFSFDAATNGLVCVGYAPRNAAQSALLKDNLIKRFGAPQNQDSLPAIQMEETSWTRPDDITLQIMAGNRASVIHCEP